MGIGAIDRMSVLCAFNHARQVKVIRVRITLAPSLGVSVCPPDAALDSWSFVFTPKMW